MIDKTNLRNEVNRILDQMITRFYEVAPLGKYQKDSEQINLDYFVRHTIETVLRIRHKRLIDALVIHYFAKHQPKLAKYWARYTEDEMLHGHMFARDLQKLAGINLDDIYTKYTPFFSTKLLNGYFHYTLEHEGPMAAIASAYFLEYTTGMTQPVWLDNLEKVFGKENLKGARSHVNHDIKESHNDLVWEVLQALIENEEDKLVLFQHLHHIYGLFLAYFQELFHCTFGKNTICEFEKVTNIAVNESNNIKSMQRNGI
ncbi:hypothetical protein BN59_02736 [Legionella massiliensis]|uniref:Pyrroloquinoline quinone (Coenzyme PQQ) biosynthesis protein C n=1 Tax=Legionella massiliensis TaxID=1034943 RepID=A0A078KZY6_9GAMM|nr:hypothetical protein [Legionella massiliensis]CDZ78426.1 hypothetical protein BN59_02736 [Legionella massiliensis]CEE14164.1 hypothetical protein BN1094_02736 [Legionella massiliensis]